MRFSWTKSFRHGVHPPPSKETTEAQAIRQFPFAPLLVVPLAQHLGKPAVVRVREGQTVERGQVLAGADGFLSAAVHSPASGKVRRVALAPKLGGGMAEAVYLEPFPASTQEVAEGTPCDASSATPGEILAAIQAAGVVGLGGAAFPTHAKLRVPEGRRVDTVVVNGAECEPFLTTDHRVMLEQSADVMTGLTYVLRATGATQAIVGVEANKRDAAEALKAALDARLPARVELLEVKYPQGAEKILIRALLGREVPSGGLPLDVGVVCINVATTAEIGRLLPHGRGVQERVITITGSAIADPGNYRIPIGTPVRFALETVGVEGELSEVFFGGPMMGTALSSLDVPIVKGTSGIVAFSAPQRRSKSATREYPCIRCARCLEACPLYLDPASLVAHAKQRDYGAMVERLHLMDCFECGSCSYVCPAHIPLAQHFRAAKSFVRKRRRTQAASSAKEGS